MSVVSPAACLPNEFLLALGEFGDRLFVRDLGFADVALNPILALQTLADDLEVKLAHPADQRLPRLFIFLHSERRIVDGELRKALGESLLVGLGPGLNGDRRDGLRERP